MTNKNDFNINDLTSKHLSLDETRILANNIRRVEAEKKLQDDFSNVGLGTKILCYLAAAVLLYIFNLII